MKIFDLYASKVTESPKLFLWLAFFITLLFAFLGKDVRLNNQFAVLFSIDNEANTYRDFYRTVFGADDGILIAILEPENVNDEFFQKIKSITSTLERDKDYKSVLTPTNTSVIHNMNDEVYVDPIFDKEELSLVEKLNVMRETPLMRDRIISGQSNTFAIIAEMPAEYDRFIKIRGPAEDFRQIVDGAFEGKDVKIQYAGIAFTRIAILKQMLADLLMLVPLTTLVIAIFSMLIFKRWQVCLITLLASIFGVVCTIGVMGLNNDDINQLTMSFPVLLMVIVVANSIHFYHRYFRELKLGSSCEEAVETTARYVSKAAFLSCFTTMIGFYALLTADMKILNSFGLYLGTGVLLSYLGMIFVIPPLLLIMKPSVVKVQDFSGDDITMRLLKITSKTPGREIVISLGVVILIASTYLSNHASYDYFLSDMLDDDHPQVMAGLTLDEKLSGALPLEISLLGEEGDFKKPEPLEIMENIIHWLQEQGYGTNQVGLSSVIVALNKAFTDEEVLPDNEQAIAQLLLIAEGSPDDVVGQLVTDDYSHARIKLNTPDLGAAALVDLQQKFNTFVSDLTKDSSIKVHLTGEVPVAYEGMNRLTQELIQSVLTALLFIVITIVLVFRDIRLALGSIFPNILPIMLGLACYSMSGKGINPLPGIAFCIAIGIAVDDTIHLFARYNEERLKEPNRYKAVENAVREVKGALYSSSIILMFGFLIFLLSGFVWNRDLGMLGAFLIITALVADLVFTPAILSFERRIKKTEAEGP